MRGEGRLGCLLFTLFLACIVYVGVQVAPAYMAKLNFEADLVRITSRAAVDNWREHIVRDQIQLSAESHGLVLRPRESITIHRTSQFQTTPFLRIKVRYQRPVSFLGYTYTFAFESESSSIVGRL
ncbi:MAG TPA: hypothetical protein VKZ59_02355 [Acidobacteriota bacterium]|nr:hypothetical protein [Acidobacteriota bacterium]